MTDIERQFGFPFETLKKNGISKKGLIEVELCRPIVDLEDSNRSVTLEMLKEVVENYDVNYKIASVLKGHSAEKEENQLGQVLKIWMDGEILKGLLMLNKLGIKAVVEKLLTKGSVFIPHGRTQTNGKLLGKTGIYLSHYAMLGSSEPHLPDLKPISLEDQKIIEQYAYAHSMNINNHAIEDSIIEKAYNFLTHSKEKKEVHRMDKEEVKRIFEECMGEYSRHTKHEEREREHTKHLEEMRKHKEELEEMKKHMEEYKHHSKHGKHKEEHRKHSKHDEEMDLDEILEIIEDHPHHHEHIAKHIASMHSMTSSPKIQNDSAAVLRALGGYNV
jgi:hypothetical protein